MQPVRLVYLTPYKEYRTGYKIGDAIAAKINKLQEGNYGEQFIVTVTIDEEAPTELPETEES